MTHRSGFVNIIGNPNVGKSTLMNALVGEKISIITSKMQTTRQRIMGIVSGDDFQIIYSDTPGIITPAYRMQEYMMKTVSSALTDADIILYVTDVVETFDKNPGFLEKLKKKKLPVLVVLNKIDLAGQEEVNRLFEQWQQALPEAVVIPVSALLGANMEYLLERIIALLPEGPAYFPRDQLTDKSERFVVSEIIREKILVLFRKEIPYSVEIEVEEFRESEKLLRLTACIHVLRESQKAILIGHRGRSLKKIGSLARKDIEEFFGKKVYLELFIRVTEDWRNNRRKLREFGYN